MKKYIIFQLAFILLLINAGYGQGFATGAVTLSPYDFTIHGTQSTLGPLTFGTGIYIGHGGGSINNNTAVGSAALISNTTISGATGEQNSAFGWAALVRNTTGRQNTAVGYGTLVNNSTAAVNTAVGVNSMAAMVSGSNNTAIGGSTLQTNLAGTANTAVGVSAMGGGNAGSYNACVGFNSGNFLTLNDNVSVGAYALGSGTANPSFQNVALGSSALVSLSGASNNVAIGYKALNFLSSGNNNVGIGANAAVPSGTADHQLSIMNVIYGTNMNTMAGGKIGIGIQTPAVQLHTTAGVRFAGLTNGTVAYVIAANSNKDLLAIPATSIGIQNSCTVSGTIPMVTNLPSTKDLGCSIINNISGNIGIDVPTPTEKLDIDCAPGGGTGNIRIRNLEPNTHGYLNTLIIDKLTGIVYMGNAPNDRPANTCSSDCDAIDNTIKSQQSQIKEQEVKIANLQTEINELRNKINQLVPGNVIVKDDNFQITPNPVTGTSTVNYKMDALITNAVFIVYDLQGKMLKKYSVDTNAKPGQVQISKKDFGNGMYILSLVSNNQEIQSKHFIISE